MCFQGRKGQLLALVGMQSRLDGGLVVWGCGTVVLTMVPL